ncbi:cytochrome b/b6 domain-containing protein [Lentilactobacillus parafarraginis]|nr:cytochrome b/b6 domain-containing protein [Lentilactobacillus parafarraginis]TLQ20234.1 cytochrome b/b6 domain-containing protein [Lentilactobacillus parafarraginis]
MLSYFALITLVEISGLIIPYIWFMIVANRRGRTWGTIAVIILFLISYVNTYFSLPDLAYPSLIDGWLMWLIGGLIVVAILKRFVYGNGQTPAKTDQAGDGIIGQAINRFTGTFGWLGKLAVGIVLAVIVFIILGSVTQLVTKMNPQPAVQSIKTDINDDTKNAPMPVIKNSSETPVVNAPQTVSTDMNNSLNSFKNSNVYDLNHMRVQMYRKKMVYVAPVEFSGGFWRYIHYLKVPGYFRTDATDKNADPKFVSKPMKYTPSAYFNSDADRRISAHSLGYSMVGPTSQLEIDDKGTPYYVRTLAKPISYLNRNYDYKHYKVAVLNTITGKVNVYSPNNVPKFVDIAVSPELVSQEVNLFGRYRKGFWNATSFGGHSGVMQPTKAGTEGGDHLTPYAYKGRVYYFTGMTSVNEHQSSILGYAFVDARTNTLHYYREHGNVMTPERAISYAQQDINPQNYRGTLPLLYRINGEPTWVVSMLDRDNNSFMKFVYLLADGNNQSGTYAVGDDAQSTLALFNQRLEAKTGVTPSAPTGKTVSGTVDRIVRTNDNKLLFILKNNGQVYQLDTSAKDFKPIYQFISEGDKVSFKSEEVNTNGLATATVSLSTFKDQSLPTTTPKATK